jgi:DNA-binding NarL/FixJ family response regulator
MEDPTAGEGAITVVLADDHTVMRSGLRMLLDAEQDLEVVAEAANLPFTFQTVRGHRPSVLVLDLNMPWRLEHRGDSEAGEDLRQVPQSWC